LLITQSAAAHVAVRARAGLLFLCNPLGDQVDALSLPQLPSVSCFFGCSTPTLMLSRLGAENSGADNVFGISIWIVESPVRQDADLIKPLTAVPD
jgi:hypothetical protein